ncbi:CdaR family transcriptional regulator [Arthrobacter rhombi]|uniref:CdaR family transcriptional regulator n=1 Tax=Arthrobacter rhombi TaxID=71253 RepID=UPI003F9340E0
MTQPLSHELAQRVIDQVAPTLEFNINMMDPAGRIIASTDPDRVGSTHTVARAVAGGEPGIVHDGGSPAERPGVNLPLRLDGKIVGVLGITGPPERVSPVAQVLVLTTVLLLERERELDDSARREAADRELLSGLVSGEVDGSAITQALASGLPEMAAPWRLYAVLDHQTAGTLEPEVEQARLPGPQRRARFGGALWVLTGVRSTRPDSRAAQIPPAGTIVLDGGSCAGGDDLAGAAQALGALVSAPDLLPEAPASAILKLDELAPELSASCLPAATRISWAHRVDSLSAGHRQTVLAFLDCGASVSATARELFLHRNTTLQRLERIAELTGLDPRIPAQAASLQLSIIAARHPPEQRAEQAPSH